MAVDGVLLAHGYCSVSSGDERTTPGVCDLAAVRARVGVRAVGKDGGVLIGPPRSGFGREIGQDHAVFGGAVRALGAGSACIVSGAVGRFGHA